MTVGMYSRVFTSAFMGLKSYQIEVEAHIAAGMPSFKIVGLPDKSVDEARERVMAAVKSANYTFPLRRITINLAPSHIPKHGTSFDLPVALSILIASHQIIDSHDIASKTLFIGSLGLNGKLKAPLGMPILIDALNRTRPQAVVPSETLITDTKGDALYAAQNLQECCLFIGGKKRLHPLHQSEPKEADEQSASYIAGNESAKRVLLIATAGHHNLSLTGPPGCGKTLLVNGITALMPPLTPAQQHEVDKIYSISAAQKPTARPFRNPHHTVGVRAMLGGGHPPTPGEISLACHGVLFLDDLQDFKKDILTSLRSAIDEQKIRLFTSSIPITFPCKFQLITAANLCPCGNTGNSTKKCTCTSYKIKQFLQKVPGSLWDRIDMHFTLAPEKFNTLISPATTEAYISERQNVDSVWSKQKRRAVENNRISLSLKTSLCPMTNLAEDLLKESYGRLGLSTRSLLHVIRVSRTIADLEDKEIISDEHVAEALSYRKVQI